ncbi:hypothetical protein GG344DRAFT_66102 [Lentinula edodes]|nr:hypothetical protein GG344DRAFT_66102 [Lentinula edodes]
MARRKKETLNALILMPVMTMTLSDSCQIWRLMASLNLWNPLQVAGPSRIPMAIQENNGWLFRELWLVEGHKSSNLSFLEFQKRCFLLPKQFKVLEQLLLHLSTDEGFDGEYDVCDHLEHGENNAYAKVLISYVSHRIGTERSQLKDHFSIVLGAFNLSRASGTAPAINLVQRRTYFYPQTPSILDERYKYDYSRPFEHPVFAGYMGAAFFSSTYYSGIIKQYSDVFVSSIQEKPNELEVPKALVALASTVIHACIQDFSSGIKDNFPTKELDGVWKLSLKILDGIQKRNRMKYHRLMHNLYIESLMMMTTTEMATMMATHLLKLPIRSTSSLLQLQMLPMKEAGLIPRSNFA